MYRRRTCGTRKTFLRVTKSIGYTDESITRIELQDGISAGIRWGSIGPDMVPIFEEQAARLERNYTLQQWADLEPMEKAIVIAVRRIDMAAKNLQIEAEIKKANHDMKKNKSRQK